MDIKYTVLIFTVISTAACLPNPTKRKAGNVRANNNDCPPLPQSCPTECYAISSTGCIVCQCPKSQGSSASNSSHTGTGTGGSSSAGNNNGCPPFPSQCDPNCLSLDSMGCPICSCSTNHQSSLQNSSSSGGAGSVPKVNGCAPFPKDCSAECAHIDAMGCIVCACQSGGSGHTSNGTSSSSSSNTYQGNSNGCQTFPKNCRTECAAVDARGCIVCQCPTSGPDNSTSISVQTASSGGNGINGCPPFPKNCDSSCVSLNDMGCVVCTCSHSSNNKTQTGVHQIGNYVNTQGQSLAGNGNGCPAIDPKCPAQCTSVDSQGCVRCTCSTSSSASQSGSVSSSNAGGCASIPKNCELSCLNIDSSGCVICSCPAAGSGFGNTCPPYNADDCDEVCKMTDTHGCPVCDCSQHFSVFTLTVGSTTASTNHNNGGVPGAGGCPAFDFGKCDPSCVSMDDKGCLTCTCSASTVPSGGQITTPGAVTSVPGAGGCPPFDFSTCDPSCVVMDSQGCMSCHCAATTQAPSGGNSNNTSGTVTSVPGAGGCPSFDFSTCDPKCVIMDDQGCLSCNCAVTMAPSGGQSSTSGTVTSVPGAGGCPSFDFSTCDPNCVVMDARGCMTCRCAATTAVPSGANSNNTSGTVTSVPGAGGCPSFDFSTCDPNCVVMDGQGCLSCQCKATTAAPSNNSSSVTSVPGAGGCPSFDFSKCDPNCVVMNEQGCMTCQCKATTSAPSGGQSTTGAVTGVPGAGGCPSFDFSTCDPNCVVMDGQGCLSCHCAASTTSPPATTKAPSGQTSHQPGTTTAVPGAGGCPSFDFSTCDPNCVVMDSRGCLSCSCAVATTTSSAPSAASVTSVPGAGGCPSFDFSKCDPNCVVMDARGCMTCSCSATVVPASGKQRSTTTTPRPTTITTTTPRPTTSTTTPRPITTHAQTTTTGGVTCPAIRCTYPCDAGVTFNSQGCPVCKCRTSSTKSP
ncbi:mucin-5AC-like [Saccostrea cucullata]|uniref:mucin-5AC-like n=1 Tax=Saccostrea cuccullata TaxID=36930 RepID=UPI002ECFBD6E